MEGLEPIGEIMPQPNSQNQQVVLQIFKNVLGRLPTNNELIGFSNAMDDGTLDGLGIEQFLKGTQENQNKSFKDVAQQYSQGLQGVDQSFYQPQLNQGLDAAESRFRRLGRTGSSGLASAFAQVGGDISNNLAMQRAGALNSLAANYFGNAQQNAVSQGSSAFNRRYELEDVYRQRGYDIQDRDYARAMYDEQQRQARRGAKRGAIGGFIGGGLGAGIGLLAGGPVGGLVGAQLGSGLGKSYGYF